MEYAKESGSCSSIQWLSRSKRSHSTRKRHHIPAMNAYKSKSHASSLLSLPFLLSLKTLQPLGRQNGRVQYVVYDVGINDVSAASKLKLSYSCPKLTTNITLSTNAIASGLTRKMTVYNVYLMFSLPQKSLCDMAAAVRLRSSSTRRPCRQRRRRQHGFSLSYQSRRIK